MKLDNINARWIWCRGEERPRNFYLYLRKTFFLSGDLREARIRVTADSRYQLFVNGTCVARGPARCDRRWQCLDQWDITPHLGPGRNVIAALAHHYGEWTFAYMLGRGGFLSEMEAELSDGSSLHLGTDASWRVRRAEAWEQSLPRMSIQTGYPELYDARKEVEQWNEAAFDDSAWEMATVLGGPGMEPWPRLVPREIPPMMECPLLAERVIESGEVGVARTGYYVDLQRVVWSTKNGVAYLATYVCSPSEVDAEIHSGSQEAMQLWVNGDLVISHLVRRDPAPEREIVPVHLREGVNVVLAKIVQGEGQWHFYFRIDGEGSERLVYSRHPEKDPAGADTVSPWWLIGPFESVGVEEGFETQYPPEREIDFTRSYRKDGGGEIRWTSAGVAKESRITSVVMSREPRYPRTAGPIENRGGLIVKGEPSLVHPGALYGTYAVIDFGKEVTGYPAVEIDRALGGEIIDLGYSEVLETPEGEVLSPARGGTGIVNPDRAGVHYADRYVCKPGRQRFQTFDKRAFRYLQLDVRNLTQPLAVGPVSIVFSTYPVEERGSFECSESLLNRIWDVGRWSVRLNMEDAYTDCPWRERGQWWGDARVQALVNYYAFGDLELIRSGLKQIAQSQTGEGLTMGVYPTDWSYGILPTFTLIWVISLHDYYEYSGDRSLVGELLPAVDRALRYFERFRSDHGLLRDVPHWLFVDWADVETAGESASVNALYHGALVSAAELADALGHRGWSREYRTLAERVRSGMRKYLWDEETKCFRDAWRESGVSPKISEQANCWAVSFKVADGDLADSVLEGVFDRHCATVRTGTPYFGFYVLDALAKRGRHERVLEFVRTEWGKMLDWGATSWWEVWEPKASFCHGWSSGPTQILQAEILGAKPAKPGWEEINIHPHPAGLAWARGRVPTPRGTVSLEWKMDEEFTMSLDIPAMTNLTIPLLKGGIVAVTDLDGNIPSHVKQLPDLKRRARFFLREPGKYRASSR
jgi:alpha-L-rhamnosidase